MPGHSFYQHLLLLVSWTSNLNRHIGRSNSRYQKCKHINIKQKKIPELLLSKEGERNLEVRRERTWRGERRQEERAWSKNFHIEGQLWAKQSWDTKTCPNSTLGSPSPAESRHLTISVAHISGGSLLSWQRFRASFTLSSNNVALLAISIYHHLPVANTTMLFLLWKVWWMISISFICSRGQLLSLVW